MHRERKNNWSLCPSNVQFVHCLDTKFLIPKTIGNGKIDCARSRSRWQTQPEKICKLLRTNQCLSHRTLNWFVLRQVFSGCVCHSEQLHARSRFLFPVVFDSFFRAVLAVLRSGMPSFAWATAWSHRSLFVVWCFTAGCRIVKSNLSLFRRLPLKRKCDRRWERA